MPDIFSFLIKYQPYICYCSIMDSYSQDLKQSVPPAGDSQLEPLIVRVDKGLAGFENRPVWKKGVKLGKIVALVFGTLWAIDGYFKFQMGLYKLLPGKVLAASAGQPAFLRGWYSWWYSFVSANPVLAANGTGILEFMIAFSLIFGFARKIAYFGGIALALLIWSVVEGFGGPYGPGSVTVGQSNIYALGLLFLMVFSSTYGSNPYTLDRLIEKRYKWWAKIAEMPKITPMGLKGWFARNSMKMSRAFAVIFGLVYLTEAFLAFYYNLPGNIVAVVKAQAAMAPSSLAGWFAFWDSQVSAAPAFYAYLCGTLEALLAACLILGLARKVGYIGGAVFAILAWGVGEGFGGMPVSGYTDPGTGIIQAVLFLILLSLNAMHGTDPFTLDARIESRFKWWRKIAEMSY